MLPNMFEDVSDAEICAEGTLHIDVAETGVSHATSETQHPAPRAQRRGGRAMTEYVVKLRFWLRC